MKKWVVGVGFLLILIGIILTSSHNIRQKVVLSEEVDNKVSQWSVSAIFEGNESLGLYFVQPKDWSFGPYPDLGGPQFSKHLIVNVTNIDTNDLTQIKVILTVPSADIPPRPPYRFTLTIYDIETEREDGLITETHPKWTGQLIALGTAKYSGNYTVKTHLIPDTVIGEDGKPKKVSPPLQLVLYKVKTTFIQPYSFLLPIGVIVTIFGVVFSVWSVRSKHQRLVKQVRKSSSSKT